MNSAMIYALFVAAVVLLALVMAVRFMLNMDDGYDDEVEHNDGEEW